MKKSFKTLAVFLSAMTLISNLSPVRAKKNFNTKESFILKYVPSFEEELRRMQMLGLREIERQRLRMAEEGLSPEEAELQILSEREEAREAELRRREEYRQDTIEELEDISAISNNYSYDFTFNIPREPITREDIENTISSVQQNIQLFEAELFPTGQNRFSLVEFKVLALVRVLENFNYNNRNNLSHFEVTQLLCILNSEISRAIEADTVTVSYYRNRLKATFSLEGTVNHEFTLIIMR